MTMKDTSDRYGMISRLNHWGGALVVLVLLTMGLYFHEMPRGDERLFWLQLHIAIGVLTGAFILFRVFWRLIQAGPGLPVSRKNYGLAVKAGHLLLLLGILFLVLSGPLMVWTAGKPIDVLGLFAIPGPFGRIEQVHEFLEEGHALVSRLVMILIAGHVLAALWHLFRDPDAWRGRMIGKD